MIQESLLLEGMRVLLVEDSADNRDLLEIFLKKAGAQVDLAQNGEESIPLALNQKYDAILMDVQMPLMDGHQATRHLRSLGCETPIIALTAHAMTTEKRRARESGFTSFLTKPLRRETLIEMIRSLKSSI